MAPSPSPSPSPPPEMKKKNKKTKKAYAASGDDLELLKSDVASFASSLGLAAGAVAAPSSGFDDSDFRKTGPLQTPPTPAPENPKPKSANSNPNPKKPHPLEINPFASTDETTTTTTTYPLMKPSALSARWYTDSEELEARVLGREKDGKAKPSGLQEMKGLVERKREVAARLMAQYAREYAASRRRSGDARLLEASARSGTSADRVSAFTCLVEDNPIANLRSLDGLLSMVTSKVGKRYAFTGFDALKELFLLRLLPDRKLKTLFQRPLSILPETKDGFSLLLFWHWEECLKQRYEKFVIALEEAIKDMLPNLKDKAMKTVFILLKSKSEQERRLLTALVNKLGDPERKAASSAAYHLSCLLSAHPNMKMVVIDEVDSFIFRPHVGLQAKYQAVNFLSQILLSKKGDGPKIAKRLVDVYFALFKVLMSDSHDAKAHKESKQKGKMKWKNEKAKALRLHPNDEQELSRGSNFEMDSRLLSALLTGVNRAFPYVASDEADDIVEVQTPILFRLVHSENFNVGVQALMLLYQISAKNQIASDRFYRALYAKLLSPAAVTSSKPELFLGLLVKAMKNDVNFKRVAAFSKRLLQVALQRPPQYACGCLFMLSEVLKAKPPLWTMMLHNESVDDDIEHFEDIIESPEDSAATSSVPNEHATSGAGDKLAALNSKVDSDSDAEDGSGSRVKVRTIGDGEKEETNAPGGGPALPSAYNPRHREPSYCNADRVSWWELNILALHVHPSVATMARTLLSGANIVYNGDPLNDLSLPAFLDKFMEKKPKGNRIAEGKWHGGSQIAPARKLDLNHHLIGEVLLQLAEDEVSPEDVVFHRFYMNKTGSKKPKAKKRSVDDEDAEELLADANNESDEEEIDDMLAAEEQVLEDEEGEYDYDDLDRVADEDDDLLGDGSDAEIDTPPARAATRHRGLASSDEEEDDGSLDISDVDAEDDGDIDDAGDLNSGDDMVVVDADDGAPNRAVVSSKKRKFGSKSGASPFASLEDYEHLMGSDEEKTNKSRSRKKSKSQKNKKKLKRET